MCAVVAAFGTFFSVFKMPPKKSNLNNARSREAQRKRVERAHQSAEQITARNAAQRIRTAESRARESHKQRDERVRRTIARTRAARERHIATARARERQRQRTRRSLTRASFVRLSIILTSSSNLKIPAITFSSFFINNNFTVSTFQDIPDALVQDKSDPDSLASDIFEHVKISEITQASAHIDEKIEAQDKKTATPTTTKRTTAKASVKIKRKEIGKIRKGKADARLEGASTPEPGTSRLKPEDQPGTSSGADIGDDDSLTARCRPSTSSRASDDDDRLSIDMEAAESREDTEEPVGEDTDRGIETVTFLEIVEQEAAEHGDALRAGAAASGLCSCCLREPSGVPLCSSAERYADMLQECFGVTMDASLRAGATICKACAAKVTEALAFKRQVLRCQTAILDLQATESVVVKEEPADETPSKEDASMDILATETARQNNFLSQMKDTYGEYVMYLQQNEQLFGPVGAMGAPAVAGAEAGADDESFLRGGCRCPLDCVSKFSESDVRAVRRLCRQLNVLCPLNANHLDVFLLGALACLYRTGRAPPGARSEDAVRHAVLGTDVCRSFFLYSYGAPQRQYDGALTRVAALLACLAGEEDPLNVAQTDVDIKEEVTE